MIGSQDIYIYIHLTVNTDCCFSPFLNQSDLRKPVSHGDQ